MVILEKKQKQFNSAMELFNTKKGYKLFGKLVSTINVSLQIFLFFLVIKIPINIFENIAAFLNGLTDPLINLIARKIYKGYKNTTDLHFAKYVEGNSVFR